MRNKQRSGPAKGRRASALIAVLWVIALLSMMVGSFAFDAHVEARITSYYRKRTKAEYLARSGLKLAEMLMYRRDKVKKTSETEFDEHEEDWWYTDAKRLSEGLAIKNMEHPLGDGKIILTIEPEPGRRNVNNLGANDEEREKNLERILEVGDIPEDLWPELIESFLDWTDKDDESRLDGAETETYYATLDEPYEAKNGPLDTVEELLLVKGFNRTILFGGVLPSEYGDEEPTRISGIGDLLTTYGDGKVNVNAASQRVLMTLQEVDEIVAGAIIEEREGWINEEGEKDDSSFKNINDLKARIPDLNPGISKWITTDSTIFRVTSIGEVHGVRREVWAIVTYSGKQLKILRWREGD